jgi:hypothetical protein
MVSVPGCAATQQLLGPPMSERRTPRACLDAFRDRPRRPRDEPCVRCWKLPSLAARFKRGLLSHLPNGGDSRPAAHRRVVCARSMYASQTLHGVIYVSRGKGLSPSHPKTRRDHGPAAPIYATPANTSSWYVLAKGAFHFKRILWKSQNNTMRMARWLSMESIILLGPPHTLVSCSAQCDTLGRTLNPDSRLLLVPPQHVALP